MKKEQENKNLANSIDFAELPLDDLIEAGELVHLMSPERLNAYVKECALKRSSAQSRRAAIRKDSETTSKPKKASKTSVEKAAEMLKILLGE